MIADWPRAEGSFDGYIDDESGSERRRSSAAMSLPEADPDHTHKPLINGSHPTKVEVASPGVELTMSYRKCLLFTALVVVIILLVCAVAVLMPKPHVPAERSSIKDRSGSAFHWQSKRLPNSISPVHYDLFLEVNSDICGSTNYSKKFFGRETITLDVTEDTDLIVMHFAHPWIDEVGLECSNGDGRSRPVSLESVTYTNLAPHPPPLMEPLLMVAIKASRRLREGERCDLEVGFTSQLSVDAKGMFADVILHSGGVSCSLVTQMEPSAARKVFPCFDEPAMKATFELTVEFNTNQFDFALFNTRQVAEETDGHLKTVKFEKSVRMSTYLVAVVFAKNFENLTRAAPATPERNYSVTHTFFAPPGITNRAEEPLRLAVESMKFYEDAFDIIFPLVKCDHFPVRNLQLFGMENWGLITYSLGDTLYDTERGGVEYEMAQANVVTHEMAHQWFGNLVTMQWWDDLWLNEGFAVFMAHLCMKHLKPELRALEKFYTNGHLQTAYHMDSFNATHPIVYKTGLFDKITYWKSCAVLSMLESVMGEQVFLSGVSAYLNQFQYANARNQDLWQFLSQANGSHIPDVSFIMNSWIHNSHVPIITVGFDEEFLYFEQQPYIYYPRGNSESWNIPIEYFFSDDPHTVHIFILTSQSGKVAHGRESAPEWVKINKHGLSIYRAHYANPGIYQVFADQIVSDAEALADGTVERDEDLTLPYIERANLYIDALASAKLGKIGYRETIELLDQILQYEREAAPLKIMHNNFFGLNDVFQRLERRGYRTLVDRFVDKHFGSVYPTLDISSWGEDERDLNEFLLQYLCAYGRECFEEARVLFELMKVDDAAVTDPSIKAIVFQTVCRHGTHQDWLYMYDKSPDEMHVMYYQLYETQDPMLIRRVIIEKFFTPEPGEELSLQGTESLRILYSASQKSLSGAYVVWDIIKSNWEVLYRNFGHLDLLNEVVISVCNNFDTQGMLEEVRQAAHVLPHFGDSKFFSQVVETITYNIDWNDNYLQETVDTFSRLVQQTPDN